MAKPSEADDNRVTRRKGAEKRADSRWDGEPRPPVSAPSPDTCVALRRLLQMEPTASSAPHVLKVHLSTEPGAGL